MRYYIDMNTYEVDVTRTTVETFLVEANSRDEAKKLWVDVAEPEFSYTTDPAVDGVWLQD